MSNYKCGDLVDFTAYRGTPAERPTVRGVVVDAFTDFEFAAEVYLGDLSVYESFIQADIFDEAHEGTWLAYEHEIARVFLKGKR